MEKLMIFHDTSCMPPNLKGLTMFFTSMQIFSLVQFLVLDLWTIKAGPYRPLPGGLKLLFCLTLIHKSFNILRVCCQNELKLCILPNIGGWIWIWGCWIFTTKHWNTGVQWGQSYLMHSSDPTFFIGGNKF